MKAFSESPKEEFNELVNSLPSNAAISASQIFLPRLSHRENLYLVPRISDAKYVIVHKVCLSKTLDICDFWPIPQEQILMFYNYLKNNSSFRVLKENRSGAVFERTEELNPELKSELVEFCAKLIKSGHLKYLHAKYMLKNCYE